MTNEYGVACLLEKHSVVKLRQTIPFLDKDNHPHISLFQFKDTNIHFLPRLRSEVSKLKLSQKFNISGISKIENNIFLDILDDSTLKAASTQIAEFYFLHCITKEPLSQVNLNCLDQTRIALVKKYGIYWIQQYFNPHITLAYDKFIALNYNISEFLIEIKTPCIYPIDKLGRILTP